MAVLAEQKASKKYNPIQMYGYGYIGAVREEGQETWAPQKQMHMNQQ